MQLLAHVAVVGGPKGGEMRFGSHQSPGIEEGMLLDTY